MLDDEEAAMIAEALDRQEAIDETPAYIGHKIPEDFLLKAGLLNESADDGSVVKPLYSLKANGDLQGMLAFYSHIIFK